MEKFEFRENKLTHEWVVIAPSRSKRPDVAKGTEPECPFCPGAEGKTPREVYRIGGGKPNQSGWQVRVVPNKYPITDTHEVIIHSPDHNKDIEGFDSSHVSLLLKVYRERFLAHSSDGQVMIFSNKGEHAGASLKHPHSQLVLIPKQINLDALVKEPIQNIVEDNNYFVTYCPDFSQWPYEVWIAPKKEGTIFGEVTDDEIKDLAIILQKALKRLHNKYQDPNLRKINPSMPFAYNFYIHHAKSWFIRIIPRLIHRAGFELGTGLSVNVVDPTVAAQELKSISV